jgi:hypothetical protein
VFPIFLNPGGGPLYLNWELVENDLNPKDGLLSSLVSKLNLSLKPIQERDYQNYSYFLTMTHLLTVSQKYVHCHNISQNPFA